MEKVPEGTEGGVMADTRRVDTAREARELAAKFTVGICNCDLPKYKKAAEECPYCIAVDDAAGDLLAYRKRVLEEAAQIADVRAKENENEGEYPRQNECEGLAAAIRATAGEE
jgi:hypothetical protein